MVYDGHVDADGGVSRRVDGPVEVRKRSVGEMDNNVYAIACTATGKALVVDAADRADLLRDLAADLDVVAVVQTHGHWDHVRAWAELADTDGWEIWGHRGDEELFPRPASRWLVDEDTLQVGDLEVKVLHTPGHTAGAIQLLVQGAERSHLFSGDSLFPGGPGNTWNDAQAFDRLMTGLERRIFGALGDDTWVYPGHGDDTTLGTERPHVSEWRARGW